MLKIIKIIIFILKIIIPFIAVLVLALSGSRIVFLQKEAYPITNVNIVNPSASNSETKNSNINDVLSEKKSEETKSPVQEQASEPILDLEGKTEEQNSYQALLDKFKPKNEAPKHIVYSPAEITHFKDENLLLSEEIQTWYDLARANPSKDYNALFFGTSMTGKTSLVRKLAKELKLPLVSVKGSALEEKVWEQRIVIEKWQLLLDELANNPIIKQHGGKYILLVDEADQIEDGLKCLKEILGDVDDASAPTNLWIMITNYIEKIDPAVYKNKERLKFKLDFSWNKSTFLKYALANNSLPEFLNQPIPVAYRQNEVQQTEVLANLLNKTGTRFDEVYKKFNFQYLNLLNKYQAEFITTFKLLIDFEPKDNLFIPYLNYQEWKSAINEHYPQVAKLESITNQTIKLKDNNHIIPKDTLLSLAFEYTLDLFWQAEQQSKLSDPWDMVDYSSFLSWALAHKYNLEQIGLTIYKGQDEHKSPCHIAKFTPKILAA